MSNVVSSDVIGRTPDLNSAEALQRLPGVSVQRDQGEGRFFQVRGTPPEFSSVSVNGVRLPTPDRGTRAVALDAVMPEVLSAIVLSKTLTPDMDADAIGGSVNLITKTAEEGHVTQSLTIGRGYDLLAKGAIGNYSAMYGRRFGPGEKFSLLVGANVSANGSRFERHGRGLGSGEGRFDTDHAGSRPTSSRATICSRARGRRTSERSTTRQARRRIFRSRANVNDFSDQENEDRWRTRFRPGTYQPGDSATASRIERTLRYRRLNDQIEGYSLKAEHTAQKFSVDALAGWTRARDTNPYREEVTFRQSNTTVQYNTADPYNPVLSLSKGNLDQANLYSFSALTQNSRDATDRDLTGRLNLTRAIFKAGSWAGRVPDGRRVSRQS